MRDRLPIDDQRWWNVLSNVLDAPFDAGIDRGRCGDISDQQKEPECYRWPATHSQSPMLICLRHRPSALRVVQVPRTILEGAGFGCPRQPLSCQREASRKTLCNPTIRSVYREQGMAAKWQPFWRC